LYQYYDVSSDVWTKRAKNSVHVLSSKFDPGLYQTNIMILDLSCEIDLCYNKIGSKQ